MGVIFSRYRNRKLRPNWLRISKEPREVYMDTETNMEVFNFTTEMGVFRGLDAYGKDIG